ncbi:IS200/IS605 family accessory protein TnpB-related protein [Anaerolactibacter massiliensis]|uniref:IS200/IS605 family accessory protein TnpB-related protein n=1 Tax=Anaerolactibacter massiliensis TaxID=2044573 RepID=UPI000CF9708E|nr:IS200/IS605 family accessory protein TnpB-related protein [Anaerolactibacter massiliensis]
MQVVGSYSVHVRDDHEALKRTADLFSDAVSHLVHTALSNWNNLSDTDSSFARLRMMECIIHSSDGFVSPDSFDHKFPKFPSYYRRAAIMQALGIVSAYQSALKNWKANGSKGEAPKLDSCKHRMPALYRGNTYKPVIDEQTGEVMPYAAKIKVFRNHDWVWDTVRLSKTDIDYLDKRGRSGDISAPVLEKKHGCWKLRFAVTETVELSAKPVSEQKICAVDLGVNTDAVCSVMDSKGTVLAHKFIMRGREKDSLSNALHRVSVFQSLHGSHDSGRLWNIAKRRNRNLAHQIAREIVNFAIANECDVIVMEHLDTKGRKRGSKKQKLAMWKHADIQKTVESLAHHYGFRISHVNAYGTSRLAYDGTGRVKRGREVSEDTPYDVCVFKSGKIYNCDLSASYNIGARYFIRGLLMESPDLMTKVSGIGSGTQRTLADLWKISRVLCPLLSATV